VERTLRCDYNSRLCATWGGLQMQKTKSIFRKAKANEKSEKTSSFAAGAGLRLRPKSACATGVGLDATVSIDLCHRCGLEYLCQGFQTQGTIAARAGLCHRSGLVYLSHGFQTQGIVAARAGLRVRPESACGPRPWISDPRYGYHRSVLEGATGIDLRTRDMDFRPKVRSVST
jgi:hypothetical protein